MRTFRWLFGAFLVMTLLAMALQFLRRPVAPHPFFDNFDAYPLVIGHADDTGQGLWPGNTLLFLEGTADLGIDMLEMDVQMTRDGQLVLMHDDTVDRTTNGTGRVADLTLAEIQALEVAVNWTPDDGQTYPYRGAGLRAPALAEVFERFPDYPMTIEIKGADPAVGPQLCALIRAYDKTDTVLVPSFSATAIEAFRAACPEVATAANGDEVRAFVVLDFVFLANLLTLDYEAFQVPEESDGIPVVIESFVRNAHGRGLQVHVWTINDPDDMQRLISLGVDGIMTDRPDVLLEMLGRGEGG